LTSFCQAQRIGHAEISGIGSITDVWVLLDPDGTHVVRNFSAGSSYEMTSLIGNVTRRQGRPRFDQSAFRPEPIHKAIKRSKATIATLTSM
jgi:predicted DNA-binding protein with PD1-like motif